MKKYQKPTVKTVSLEYEAIICTSQPTNVPQGYVSLGSTDVQL